MNLWEKRKAQILMVLLLLLAASLYYTYMRSEPRIALVVSVKTRPPHSVQTGDEKLLIGLLSRNPPRFGGVDRNVFQFRQDGGQPQNMDVASLAPQSAPRTAPAAGATASAPDVRYMGYYREREGTGIRLAAIVNGGQVFVGGVGDVLGDKYRLVEINEEYLVLKLIHENQTLRLPLGKP